MDHILPPLSDWQTVQLSICLPLLAATLKENDVPEYLLSQVMNATTPLTEFALDSQNFPRARSDSASCLFWIVLRHQRGNQNESCLAKRILEKVVFPEIWTRLQILRNPQNEIKFDTVDAFRDALNLASVLVRFDCESAYDGAIATLTLHCILSRDQRLLAAAQRRHKYRTMLRNTLSSLQSLVRSRIRSIGLEQRYSHLDMRSR